MLTGVLARITPKLRRRGRLVAIKSASYCVRPFCIRLFASCREVAEAPTCPRRVPPHSAADSASLREAGADSPLDDAAQLVANLPLPQDTPQDANDETDSAVGARGLVCQIAS